MTTEYIQVALRRAKYELQDNPDYTVLPKLPGVMAYRITPEAGRQP